MHFVVPIYEADVFNYTFVRQMLVGLLPGESQYFPQGNRKGPHIRFRCELALQRGIIKPC